MGHGKEWKYQNEWSNQVEVLFNEIRSIIMGGKKKSVCTVHCVICLIQTYNVNSYNILGLH